MELKFKELFLTIQDFYIRIRTRRIRRKAIKDQTKRALYMIEVDNLFAEWLTFAILNGQIPQEGIGKANQDLLNRRSSVKNQEMFISFIKTLK